MKVLRKQEVIVKATNKFMIGDQIQVGKYTATCQKVTGKGAIFLLDQYLDAVYPMNRWNVNVGGYTASDLRTELQKEGILDIFSPVRKIMVPFKNGDLLRIPYAEELFGHIDDYKPGRVDQWELMKDCRNRIAVCGGFIPGDTGWLQNRVKSSRTLFATVNCHGHAHCVNATGFGGVRPVFQLGRLHRVAGIL